MLHMNPGDDRENTLENLRELVENCYHDQPLSPLSHMQ